MADATPTKCKEISLSTSLGKQIQVDRFGLSLFDEPLRVQD
jgi:hypothetical protein